VESQYFAPASELDFILTFLSLVELSHTSYQVFALVHWVKSHWKSECITSARQNV